MSNDGGEVRVSGDDRMKQSVDSGEGSCVGAYIVLYVYLVFPIVHFTLLFRKL